MVYFTEPFESDNKGIKVRQKVRNEYLDDIFH